ncbi:hypothetical protein DASB73_042920 [Starmerella bacillaris]|uniref:Uncharacterized protein n=1 Tax=Starmerella bacillaris TaxID=1247836 RepID=A0AAV5RS31_STABA|nr:hypothetical protein DASB73_042920 [Starmerella bacillaris]
MQRNKPLVSQNNITKTPIKLKPAAHKCQHDIASGHAVSNFKDHKNRCTESSIENINREIRPVRRPMRRNSFSVPSGSGLVHSQYHLLKERHAFRSMLREVPLNCAIENDEESLQSIKWRMHYMVDTLDTKLSRLESMLPELAPFSVKGNPGLNRLSAELHKLRGIE